MKNPKELESETSTGDDGKTVASTETSWLTTKRIIAIVVTVVVAILTIAFIS